MKANDVRTAWNQDVKWLFQIDERTTEGWRLTVQRRLTIGWIQIESIRLVGFKSRAYDWLVLNSKQEGLWLVGFKYQKASDWLDSKFHFSYLESRGVPEKNARNTGKKRGKLSPFDFRWRHLSKSSQILLKY